MAIVGYLFVLSYVCMTINDYLNEAKANVKASFDAIVTQAKEINASNPAILRREDQHIESSQEAAFAKTLAGLPIVIKDNILLENTVSSCGSRMLEHYIAPYTSTVVRRLEDA
jgi:Asp-tRNA(Asn)/Glu-tRNA(Gln) amidotransferase A subunit family amidase